MTDKKVKEILQYKPNGWRDKGRSSQLMVGLSRILWYDKYHKLV